MEDSVLFQPKTWLLPGMLVICRASTLLESGYEISSGASPVGRLSGGSQPLKAGLPASVLANAFFLDTGRAWSFLLL